MQIEKLIIDTLSSWASAWIGAFGGASYHFYLVSKGQHFVFKAFLINVFLAFFVGWLAGKIIPDTMQFKDAYCSVAGVCALQILDIIIRRVPLFLESYIQGRQK